MAGGISCRSFVNCNCEVFFISFDYGTMKSLDLRYLDEIYQEYTEHAICWRCVMHEQRILSDPDIMMGKPVIRGTRITVELILKKIAAGHSIEQILEEYPHLTREGVVAAIAFIYSRILLRECLE
jgi:uncharacterized protein (DUF433 family)